MRKRETTVAIVVIESGNYSLYDDYNDDSNCSFYK